MPCLCEVSYARGGEIIEVKYSTIIIISKIVLNSLPRTEHFAEAAELFDHPTAGACADGCKHLNRIETEERAKVVACAWGEEFIQILAALTVLH